MKTNDVTVKKSKIDWMWVFANRDFKKGEVVIKWDTSNILTALEVKNLPENDKKYVTTAKDIFFLQQPPARFVNHSCNPNTEVIDKKADIAIRDIKEGEEITSDYLTFFSTDKTIKCNCKSEKCKKL